MCTCLTSRYNSRIIKYRGGGSCYVHCIVYKPFVDFMRRCLIYLICITFSLLKNIKALPDFIQFKSFPGTPLKEIFIAASDDLLAVLAEMLKMDPIQRCTSTQVCTHTIAFTVESVNFLVA